IHLLSFPTRRSSDLTEDDSVIRLTDIATVEDTFKKEDGITLVNGSPSLVLSVMKKTDGNTVDVAEDVLASMKELNKDLPDGVERSEEHTSELQSRFD